MENRQSNKLGMNRTGTDSSPSLSRQMAEGAEKLTKMPPGSEKDVAMNRIRYINEADPLGSVPPPATMKGMVQTGMQMLKGNRMQTLVDKLAERLSFERTGTRLYDALISKHEATQDTKVMPPLEVLKRFREEELQHFHRVASAIREIGADPTAMTPGADVMGVASMGLVQVLTDSRTTFLQSLEAILIAELADNDGWEVLIQLTEEAGLESVTEDFRAALREEQEHLAHVREWVKSLVRKGSGVLQSAA